MPVINIGFLVPKAAAQSDKYPKMAPASAAVLATYKGSNGQVEDEVNKLKMLKRTIFGPALIFCEPARSTQDEN